MSGHLVVRLKRPAAQHEALRPGLPAVAAALPPVLIPVALATVVLSTLGGGIVCGGLVVVWGMYRDREKKKKVLVLSVTRGVCYFLVGPPSLDL